MQRRSVFWILAALATVAAAWQAWELRWTCDDAYISFRYAQHFAEGHGLVFNLDPGEAPVEGYSNFTWTLWLAFGWWLGCTDAALETWSNVWGVLCHAGTVGLLAVVAWRSGGGRATAPIAACGYAAVHHAASLAPAGLETALFVLLAALLLKDCLEPVGPRRAAWLGVFGTLAAMTRPDGALLAAVAGAFVLHDAWRTRTGKTAIGFAAPILLVFAPYLLWRLAYYGDWLPNTYYAKSDGDPLLGLGGNYVVEFVTCYWALFPAVLVLAWLLLRRRDRRAMVITAFTVPYVAFVVYVGGDFMFARFLLPVLPALLFGLDVATANARSRWVQPVVAVLLIAGLLLRSEPPWLGDPYGPVSDNRRISRAPLGGVPGMPATEAARRAGNDLRGLFDGLGVRIGIGGSQANLAFRSRVPVAIECAAGLTDRYLAHLPGKARTKVAHTLGLPHYTGYLERRGVHFTLEGNYGKQFDAAGTAHDFEPWRDILFPTSIGPVPARLVVYDRELMRELRRRAPSMVATDLEQHLDGYIAAMAGKTKDAVRGDYAKFRAAWFDHPAGHDAERQAVFERFLQ